MTHARTGDPHCAGTWPISGRPCQHIPLPGLDVCPAHHPDGDQRPEPPPDDKRCQGTCKESGERCRYTHIPGGGVCRRHGGGAPQVRAKAKARVTEEGLVALATDLVGKPVANPLAELARVAGRARAWTELLEGHVRNLIEAPAPTGECPHCGGELDGAGAGSALRYEHRAGEQIRGEIQLYERAMAQFARVLADIGRLKIDERLAAITSRQADAVIAALEAGLNAAGVRDPGQRTAAKAAASRELRAVK